MSLASEFLSSVVKRFQEQKALGDKTFAQLNDKHMLVQPNDSSNSIGIIIQHLHGNMLSRWMYFLTEDGEKPWRKRDAEFEADALTKNDLLHLWDDGWRTLMSALESLTEDDLLKTVTIRSQPLSVVDAINRQLAHYSYHVGQIVYIGRWLKDSEWECLSIPKGGSDEANKRIRAENGDAS